MAAVVAFQGGPHAVVVVEELDDSVTGLGVSVNPYA
jgi:hypothetical protein